MNDISAGKATRRCDLLLAGGWVSGEGRAGVVTDRYTGAPFADIAVASEAQIDAMIEAAHEAFLGGAPNAFERGAALQRAADLVDRDREDFVDIIVSESGFTRSDATGEVNRCIQTLRLSAEEAHRLCGELVPMEGAPGQAGRFAFTLRAPLGVVLCITPFNSPLNTVAHKIAPAFAAGNAVILKPASATPMTAVRLAQALLEGGLPPRFLSVLHCAGAETARAIADPRVRFIAFTGSTEVGRRIQAAAELRRTQMELGSIAFTLVNDDADLDRALPKIVGASFRKAGQVCTSVQMLLVHRARYDEVEARLTEMVGGLAYGDPRSADTITGPLISDEDAERVEGWIAEAVEGGARRLAGGARNGRVVPPTLLADVAPSMKVVEREVFGPVLCLAPLERLEEAIVRVNATPFGLATGLFTNRLGDAFAAAKGLEVGGVHVNETSSSRVDLMPYGGSKASGFGREGPRYAVHEMTEERIVTITP